MQTNINHQKTFPLIYAVILVIIAFFIFEGFHMFSAPKTSDKQVAAEADIFAEYISKNEFAAAQEIVEDTRQNTADGHGQILASYENTLEAKLNQTATAYLNNQIDLVAFSDLVEQVKRFALPLKNISKYDAIIKAEGFYREQKFTQAEEAVNGVIQAYPNDPLLTQYQAANKALVEYSGPVQHIFFHPLIIYPQLAFYGNQAKGYNDFFVTVKEFDTILASLYKNNFVLIDINSIYDEKVINGKKVLSHKKLLLPPDKKPLIISIDDLNYYNYMIQNGNAYKLMLDSHGDVAAFSVTPDGEQITSRDNEIIPILDEFCKKHPDFTFKGAKGVIALTGYQGILGYRTQQASQNADNERNNVLPVIERLKETGWSFASHGYGHLDAKKIDYAALTSDTLKWKTQVEPLIGPTNVYIYPFGSKVLPGDPKFKYLLDSGFNVLCSVGPRAYMKLAPEYIMMDRRHIDGIALLTQSATLQDLFDSSQVIDNLRPVFK